MADNKHYLKTELYDLVKNDDSVFNFLQEGSLDGIWYWDLKNQENEWMSPRFWKLLGVNPDEKKHLASEWQDLINPDDLKLAIENFTKHCEDPNHPYDQIVRYRHQNGSTVWVRCRGIIIRNEKGVPLRMLGAHTDITLLKRAEEELLQINIDQAILNKQLENEIKLKTQLVSLVSHDLRSPLGNVVNILEIMDDILSKPIDDKQNKILKSFNKKAIKTIVSLSNMSKTLLNMSRIDFGSLKPQFEITNLYQIIQNNIEKNEFLAEKKGVTFNNKVPDDLEILTDNMLLQEVFANLLSNAMKFSETGNQVNISLSEINDQFIKIAVQDNGVGIPESLINDLFKKEVKTTRTGTKGEKGTGFGLPFCKDIMQALSGKIYVKTVDGKGSTFYIEHNLKLK